MGPDAGVDATAAREAEQCLLGCMMLDGEALSVGLGLPREAWWVPAHQVIVRAMAAMTERGLKVDLVSMNQELSGRPFGGKGTELEAIGGFSYLSDLSNTVPTTLHAPTYAEQIRQAWVRRGLSAAADLLSLQARDGSVALDELRAALTKAALAIDARVGGRGPRPLREILFDRLADYEAISEGTADLGVASTGFSDLDRIALPWQPGDVIVLSADNTARGKTSLAMQIALSVAGAGGIVYYASIEMSDQGIADRVAVQRAALDLWRLRRRETTDREWQALAGLAGIPGADTAMIDDACHTTWDVTTHAQALAVRLGPLAMIVVDHLHQLSDHSARGEDTTASRMAAMVGRLKVLAMDMHCPLLLVAQTGRRGRGGDDPQLNDLRDSAAIEDVASVVMFIRWDNAADHPDFQPVRLIVAKNRNGKTGTVKLVFDTKRALFYSQSERSKSPGAAQKAR